MNMRQYRKAAVLGMLAMGAMQASAAETFRCVRADGSISFQQMPCPLAEVSAPERATSARSSPAVGLRAPATANTQGSTRASVDTPQSPKLSPVPADEPYGLLTRRKREVLDLTARLERCRADQPGFAALSADLYPAWRRRHEDTLAEYERLLALKVRELRRSDAVPLSLCSEEWLRSMEPLARQPDPRFNSVEKTWAMFVEALLAADRATLMNCVTGTAAARLKQRIDLLSDSDLRRMGGAIRGLKVQWGDDYEKEGLIAHDDRVDGIAFRRVNDEWKIGNL
jgi:hypothetical protein